MRGDCRLCELPDGRRLAYAQWGDLLGMPVFYCHGFPGSRLEAHLGDAAARRLGIRLIAPDRPGFGESTLQPHRRLSDWPDDLIALADSLELDRFHLLGVSGGGPYALACGQLIGARIALDSFVVGRSTGTMLNIPNWWSEATIPLAFMVLLAQCLVEGLRLLRGDFEEEERPPTEGEP